MPSLNWIGKEAVINHHRQVPYHLLRCDNSLSCGDPDSGNLLVEGDNLLALKALLPYYAGQVKCIYIDPPFNSGEQKWTYNDHVDSPEMRKWLGKVVGGEAEDLSRHDKWLCMMYPRMQLLIQFLKPDGMLFISLDDTEISRFRIMMEEILPQDRFVATLIWKSRRNIDSRHKQNVSEDHEFVLAYHGGKSAFRGSTKDLSKYNNPDNDPRGPWMSDNLVGLASKERRPNLHYDLVNPDTGDVYACSPKGWRYSQETMAEKIAEARIMWPKNKSGRPRHKKFLSDLENEFMGFSSFVECGNTNEGTEELQHIMNGGGSFIFPKPRSLVETLIDQVTQKGEIVLDIFSGNRDGLNRKFILIEMEPQICEKITTKRLSAAINGYSYKGVKDKNIEIKGLGGGVRYCRLDKPLFDETGKIGETVKFADLAAHVFFTETGGPIPKRTNGASPFLGTAKGTGYYLLFNGILGDKTPDGGNVLTGKVLAGLPKHKGPKVIFGEGCRLGDARLRREQITFKQLPYEIKVS
jgi:site-specific DNA-methyltransferase (adenine-specific)/adenine-specific DNA-methyltransferase